MERYIEFGLVKAVLPEFHNLPSKLYSPSFTICPQSFTIRCQSCTILVSQSAPRVSQSVSRVSQSNFRVSQSEFQVSESDFQVSIPVSQSVRQTSQSKFHNPTQKFHNPIGKFTPDREALNHKTLRLQIQPARYPQMQSQHHVQPLTNPPGHAQEPHERYRSRQQQNLHQPPATETALEGAQEPSKTLGLGASARCISSMAFFHFSDEAVKGATPQHDTFKTPKEASPNPRNLGDTWKCLCSRHIVLCDLGALAGEALYFALIFVVTWAVFVWFRVLLFLLFFFFG